MYGKKNYSLSIILLIMIISLFIFSNCRKSDSSDKVLDNTEMVSKKSLQRKNRSLEILELNQIPVDKTLPVIQDEAQTTLRTKEEVVYRAMSLLVVAIKAQGLEQEKVNQLVRKYGVKDHFSPRESQFVSHPNPPDDNNIQYSWRYESAWVLLWALSFIDLLDFPVSICDVDTAVAQLGERGKDTFLKQAKLRPETEILNETDLAYRYLGAVNTAMENNEAIPGNLYPDVLQERLLALRWLTRYNDKKWDDVDITVAINKS